MTVKHASAALSEIERVIVDAYSSGVAHEPLDMKSLMDRVKTAIARKDPLESGRKLIAAQAVKERFGGISHMTLYRWTKSGVLPEPVQINGRNYWNENDIDAVLSKKSGGDA